MQTTTNNQNPNDFNTNPSVNAIKGADSDADASAGADTDKDTAKSDENMGAAFMAKSDKQDTKDAAKDVGDVGVKDKKDQLHRRVMARIADLEAQCAKIPEEAKNSEHAKALQNEISLAKDMMGGGWDRIGEVEAARLSQWLDGTQNLLEASKPDPASGEPMHTRLPADGAVATDGKLEASKPQTNMS